MRKEDITVTTPLKSTIYAIGTRPESNPNVWADYERYKSANYRPGYVLEVKDNGFAVVLLAEFHPNSKAAEVYGQATALDALDYDLNDHAARQAVMAKYSHWPLNAEQREAKEVELAKLKKLPDYWLLQQVRTTYVRMLWAEYQTRLDAVFAKRKAAEDEERARRDAAKADAKSVIEKIIKHKLGIKKSELDYMVNRASVYDGSISLPTATVVKLVEAYEDHQKRTVSETEINRQAQDFYNASGITLDHMTDKPKIVAGLVAVLTNLGFEIEDEA